MKTCALLLACLVAGSILIFPQKKSSEPQTVNYVDLKKYVGTWYEIAKIPNRFQSDCDKNTTANYKIREDGKIAVLNKCVEKDGSINDAEGVAVINDKKTNAKLEVSFVSILGINLFWGDYWIIGLDNNYKYAVVGHPERKYGWILCREPKMSEEDLSKVFALLKEKGYDPNKFVMTRQDKN
jgi:apolipoprotein D and lipocalin family protein